MQKKLFTTYFVIILVTVAISGITYWTKGYRFVENLGLKEYLSEAKILTDVFKSTEFTEEYDYEDFAKEYGGKYGIRITIINQDGDVIADSLKDPETLENHGDRKEIKKALEGKANSVKRYSKTLNLDYCYSAVPLSVDGLPGVLRVSVPFETLKQLDYNLIQAIALALVISSVAAILVAIYFMRYIAKPIEDLSQAAEEIANGNYDTKIYTRQTGPLKRVADAFNNMSAFLKVNMKSLTKRNIELEAMLCSMTSGVVAIDDENGILFYNDRFISLTGIEDRNITRQSLYNVFRSAVLFDVIDQVRDLKNNCVEEGKLRVHGEKIIRVTGTPLHEREDKPLGVLIVIEDITKIKKLEHMRSDFVSNVTHELKTPLTSIRGFVDTLKNGAMEDPKVSRKFLDIIDIEAERLYTLIQDILLLSEIESKKERNIENCDIARIGKEVVELLSQKAKDGTRLLFKPNPNLKLFDGSPDRIKQLFINLIDNAINYTEKGTITIICEKDKDDLLISVEDTGIGMDEEHLSRIFERFYRVDKGRSRKQGGTGLGLSIVKHIVEMHQGTIEVTSQVDVGTRFTIRLPYLLIQK